MFDNIKISTDDKVWKKILADLGAVIHPSGIKFTAPTEPVSPSELIRIIDLEIEKHFNKLNAASLSHRERRLVLMLPANSAELKSFMGYAIDTDTHSIGTLIYNIRKKMGQNFIRIENGIYSVNSQQVTVK